MTSGVASASPGRRGSPSGEAPRAPTSEDSTTTSARPQEVFAFVGDVSHLPDHLPPITEAGSRPLAEGTGTDPDVQPAGRTRSAHSTTTVSP